MYVVRKRFMYWYIPGTIRLHLSPDRNARYCFSPARLVKKVKQPGNYIVDRFITDLDTSISERRITVTSFQ